MADPYPHLSVHREIEAIKEAVALKSINACANWLRDRGHPELAEQMLAEMIEKDQ
jgi:hypothetical protein|tara:strand:+ start:67951 stop:68115 length:165 start_codon:yes stop_codon:yes gene_type:complete